MTILRTMVEDLPPCTPDPIASAIREKYDRLLRMPPAVSSEVEDVIIAFGRMLWPYRKAFEVLVRESLKTFTSRDLTRKLPADLSQRYATYATSGKSLADLLDTPNVRSHFSREDQGMLCDALAGARLLAAKRVRRAIAEDNARYQTLVKQFLAVQHDIDQHLSALRRLAEQVIDDDEAHRMLRETIREFDRGFASLAREPKKHEVCAALESHRERAGGRRRRRPAYAEHIFD